MSKLHRLFSPLPFILICLLSGCISRPNPDIAHFLVAAPTLRAAPLTTPYTVKILPVKIAAPYASTSFVYRMTAQRYERDFYHRFLSTPSQMLTEAITAGLSQGGLFKTVLTGNHSQEGDVLLEITATEFYADYQASPAAVLTLHTYLARSEPYASDYLVSDTISVRVPMHSRSATAYTEAMQRALAQALQQIQDNMAARFIKPI